MFRKQGIWISYELQLSNADFAHAKCYLLGINARFFLQRVENPMRRDSSVPRLCPQLNIHGKTVCCVFGGITLVSYSSNRTKLLLGLYRTQLMTLILIFKVKRAHYYLRGNEFILLHNNVGAPVKIYLQILNWDVLPYPSH